MKKLARAAAVGGALTFALSGCASVTQGTTEDIKVTSLPVDGANCTLKNGVGAWSVTTPGSAKVDKSKTDLDVTCSKTGFQDGHTIMESHFEGMTAGNLILGGGIGLAVDASTGAMNHYDKAVEVTLTPMDGTPAPAPSAAATPAAPASTEKTTS